MTEAAPLPAWIAAIFDREETPPRQAPEGVELDLPYSIAEAERWLDRQPRAAEGIASDLLFKQACRLKDFAISPGKAVELLHARNPAYAEDDIGQRVENAWKHGQNEPGSDRPKPDEEVFAGIEPPPPPEPFADVGFRPMAWLRAQTFPPTRWEWEKRIPSFRPIIITGPPKTGKTTFLLNLALHMAAGAEFLGAKTRPSHVAMLLAEDEYRELRGNLEAIRQARGFDQAVLDRLHIRSVLSEPVNGGHWLARVSDGGGVEETAFMREIVMPFLRGLEEPVWMVDPLVEFVAFNRYSEQAPRGLVHWLNSVARAANVTPLITDHPTIASVEQGRDIGGSVQMEGSFPTVAALKAEAWKTYGMLRARPMSFALKYARYAPEHSVSFFRREGSPAFYETPIADYDPNALRKAVYRHVTQDPNRHVLKTNHGYGPLAVSQVLGVAEAEVKDALASLLALRWLQYHLKTGGGDHSHYERGPEGPKLSELEAPEKW